MITSSREVVGVRPEMEIKGGQAGEEGSSPVPEREPECCSKGGKEGLAVFSECPAFHSSEA